MSGLIERREFPTRRGGSSRARFPAGCRGRLPEYSDRTFQQFVGSINFVNSSSTFQSAALSYRGRARPAHPMLDTLSVDCARHLPVYDLEKLYGIDSGAATEFL